MLKCPTLVTIAARTCAAYSLSVDFVIVVVV
jgi:hypothetical protein